METGITKDAAKDAAGDIQYHFDQLLEILPTGVVILNEAGDVQQSNTAANTLLGLPLIGRAWCDIIQQCFSPKVDDGHDISLKNGQRIHLQTRSLPHDLGQLILLHDVTETRLLQMRIEQHKQLLALGQMTASLAHQIRTPLSSAMLYASHLIDSQLSDQQRLQFSQRIMDSLQHLERQVKDMLLFARAEIPLTHEVVLSDLFESLYQTMLPVLKKTHSELILNLHDSNFILSCHKDALLGAFINLVNNAIEAVGKKARIVITTSVNDKNQLMISLEDQGPGIPDHLQAQIFKPFFSTKDNGTGLGLSVVESVAKSHGAEIYLGNSSQGAKFIFVFPASEYIL